MNILSVLSVVIATVIIYVTIRTLKTNIKTRLKILLILVEISLSWWCIFYGFFYVAKTKEEAIMLHKLSSFGWTFFALFAAGYYIEYTGNGKRFFSPLKVIFMLVIPVYIFIKNLYLPVSVVVVDLIQSKSGLGWTYVSDIKSLDYWIYILNLLIYFGIIFILLLKYQKSSSYRFKKKIILGFIILETTVVIMGVTTDFIMPHYSKYLPPMSNMAIGLFQIGYFVFLHKYDIFNADKFISSRAVIDTCTNPIVLLDGMGYVVRINKAMEEIIGLEKSKIENTLFIDYIEDERKENLLEELYKNKKINDFQLTIKKDMEENRIVMVSAMIIEDKRKQFQGIVISMNEVSEIILNRKKLEANNIKYRKLADEYFHQSNYDILTDLPNRRFFYKTLEEYYDSKKQFSVIFMDLDGFKEINDTYGHEIGDKVLIEVAKRLKYVFDENYFISRMGGDEFTGIVLSDDQNYIEEIKKRTVFEFEKEMKFDNIKCRAGISFGYGIYKEDKDLNTIIKEADSAMYKEKQMKKIKKGI